MTDDRGRTFRLLETADNFIKYGRHARAGRSAERARKRYEEAAALAEAAGDEDMLRQARLRLEDLDRRAALAEAGARDSDDPDPVEARIPPHAADRVPPHQRVTGGWPVLHEGPIPRFDAATWRFTVHGACASRLTLTYWELRDLPIVQVRSDFHCVTGWSKLDNLWTGIRARDVLEKASPLPDSRHVSVGAPHGYDANVPLAVLMEDDALLAWGHNGRDLPPKHGGPLRLIIPKLYGWKSVKWVDSFELLTSDRRGFWEIRGYHNRADPWREERYSYQE